jgi:hypothetical protein
MSVTFKSALIASAVSTIGVFGYTWWQSDDLSGAVICAGLFYVFMWGFPLMFLAATEE